jgi:hypothetical protein
VGVAAVAAAPLVLAIAEANQAAADAQNNWNKAQEEGTKFVNSLPPVPDQTNAEGDRTQQLKDAADAASELRQQAGEVYDAFSTWDRNVTVNIGNTTGGLEDAAQALQDLNDVDTSTVLSVIDHLGGINNLSDDQLQNVAQTIIDLAADEATANDAAYTLMETNRGLNDTLIDTAHDFDVAAAAAAGHGQNLDILVGSINDTTLAYQNMQISASQAMAASAGHNQNAFEESGGIPATDVAYKHSQTAAYNEAKQAEEDASRQAEANATKLASLEDQLASAIDRRADAAANAAKVEEDYATKLGDIDQAYNASRKDAAKTYEGTVRDVAANREKIERDLAAKLKDIDQQRAQVAADTEQQLADLASKRADIQAAATQKVSDAEEQYQQTVQDSVAREQDLRDQLRENTRQAAEDWAAQKRDSQQALRQLDRDFKEGLSDRDRTRDRRTEDIQTDMSRAAQDRDIALAGATTPEERARIELDYQRKIADLQLEQTRLAEDAKDDESDALQDYKDKLDGINKDRNDAEKAYHDKVKGYNDDFKKALDGINADQAKAQQDLAAAKDAAYNDEKTALNDLDTQAAGIYANQAKEFKDLESQKQVAQRETEAALEKNARDATQAQGQYNRDVASAAREHESAVQDAGKAYTEAAANASKAISDIEGDISDIQGEIDDVGQTTVAPIAVEKAPEFDKNVSTINSDISAVTDTDHVVTIAVDVAFDRAALDADMADVKTDYDNKLLAEPSIDLDTIDFNTTLATSKRALETFANTTWVTALDASWGGGDGAGEQGRTGPALLLGSITDAEDRLETFKTSTWETTLDATNVAVGESILDAEHELDEFTHKVYNASIGILKKSTWDADMRAITTNISGLIHPSTNDGTYKVTFSADMTDVEDALRFIASDLDGETLANAIIKIKDRTTTAAEAPDPLDGPPPSTGNNRRGPVAGAIGMHASGQYAMVGEYGPERVWLPAGANVISAGATSAWMQHMASGGHAHHHNQDNQNHSASSGTPPPIHEEKKKKKVSYNSAFDYWLAHQPQAAQDIYTDLRTVQGIEFTAAVKDALILGNLTLAYNNGVGGIFDQHDMQHLHLDPQSQVINIPAKYNPPTQEPGGPVVHDPPPDNRTVSPPPPPPPESLPSPPPTPVPPPPPLPTEATPLPPGTIAGDIPQSRFDPSSQASLIGSAAMSPTDLQRQFEAAGNSGPAAGTSGSSPVEQLTAVVRKLDRQIGKLAEQMGSLAERVTAQNVNLGTQYVTQGGSSALTDTTESVRTAIASLRL